MPCYSRIQTKLIDRATILKAAQEIGAKIAYQLPNTLGIEKNGEVIRLDRYSETENFTLMTSQSSQNYENLLDELTKSYAKTTLKAWAKKEGYQFSAGKKPGDYVMTQYTGK